MFVVIVIAMALVVGGAAVVALGGGGTLPEAEHDRLAVRLPQDRALSRTDVDELRLPMALRGYRMDEVDDLLDRLGAELSLRDARIAELEAVGAVRGSVAATEGATGEPLPGLESFTAVLEKAPQGPATGEVTADAEGGVTEATDLVADQDADTAAGPAATERKGDRA
ncbi:DivIVA domain-containing protein [Kitasatospora sp. YST-16]|uniref:DivIVA domain-containing protein n=1 Tax=unclassified Kitasatospora TaxID=2633591 RepID=UPI0007C5C0CF|nr:MULTISPECIES: DivIVA domain-containing protein [unclassified Kitasatospora]WAL73712.1 DivIVA domain-containing protein [Kitasatospora sp. YST-16]WNW39776.1 DivIVA domain-containing protein [Streptomyces sp. Li-HN-5-13]